jgi:hypothetical protein
LEEVKKEIIMWFMQSSLYNFFMNHVVWRIRFTTYYPNLSGVYYHAAYEVLQPSDVVLTTDDLKLTSYLIPGNSGADHAALCISKDKKREIIEATHKGVKCCTFADTWKESTRIIIMRCLKWDEEYKREVISKSLTFENKPYDTSFNNPQAIYCSELIMLSDYQYRANYDLSDIAGIGMKYISPSGLLFSYSFICVYDSKGEYTGLTGDQIEKKVLNAK